MTPQRIRLRGVSTGLEGQTWESACYLGIGRMDNQQVLLEDASISRRHAEILRKLHLQRTHAQSSQELSDAERRVLRLLASDLSLREIGRELFLSMNTVKTHKRAIYRKLGVSSRTEAVRAVQAPAQPTPDNSPG